MIVTGFPPDAARRRPSVDRLLEVTPGSSARGVKAVPNTWQILDSHFPRFPVLPGVLLLDAMAETAAAAAGGTGRDWRLAGVQGVRFRHFVRPGDLVEIEASVTALDEAGAVARCRVQATADGVVVATVKVLRLVDGRAPGALGPSEASEAEVLA